METTGMVKTEMTIIEMAMTITEMATMGMQIDGTIMLMYDDSDSS